MMHTDAVTEAIRAVADAEIMPRFRSLADDEIIEKRPGDVVTVADRLAEQVLTAIFRQQDPGCLVVGEEGVYADAGPLKALPSAELAWVIDPVDGTRNFANGSPDFAVMVAEVRRGVTTRSWICQPVHELMYYAELGAGVTRNGTGAGGGAVPTRGRGVARPLRTPARGAGGRRPAGAAGRLLRGGLSL
ncbi:MAG: hypothetical protein IPL41_05285 [Micropruina sp.]|nr:hypothetical protein [Micropruina sp.]